MKTDAELAHELIYGNLAANIALAYGLISLLYKWIKKWKHSFNMIVNQHNIMWSEFQRTQLQDKIEQHIKMGLEVNQDTN